MSWLVIPGDVFVPQLLALVGYPHGPSHSPLNTFLGKSSFESVSYTVKTLLSESMGGLLGGWADQLVGNSKGRIRPRTSPSSWIIHMFRPIPIPNTFLGERSYESVS